jgi:hypothetical protein
LDERERAGVEINGAKTALTQLNQHVTCGSVST